MTDIVDKTQRLYRSMGATFAGAPNWAWAFPSGATVRLAYIASDNDIFQYLGPRYSFIGFDESTFHTEYQVRNMLGCLSSTDRTLLLRMRLASNPGNAGAAWHKLMFLRGACPVHNPEKSAESGKLYWERKWPSDKYALQDEKGNGFSVAFIPGRLTDHNLLDDKYIYRLRMMSGSLSKAMEQGCWCELQGAYFSNWDANRMVIPYGAIGAQWWDNHFISLDYGFGKSSASAHLHVKTQDEKIRTVGEFVAAHMPAYEFASEVCSRFVAPLTLGQRRKIIAVYLDPSNFKHIGDGHTIANQINEILDPYGLACLEASNDRVGGWQLMYQMLQTGQWQIADTCPRLIEAIPSRMHDEKRPGDILKVPPPSALFSPAAADARGSTSGSTPSSWIRGISSPETRQTTLASPDSSTVPHRHVHGIRGRPRAEQPYLDLLTEVGAQRERAVIVQFLVTRPPHGIAHSLYFDLSSQSQRFPICPLWQHKLRLPNLAR